MLSFALVRGLSNFFEWILSEESLLWLFNLDLLDLLLLMGVGNDMIPVGGIQSSILEGFENKVELLDLFSLVDEEDEEDTEGVENSLEVLLGGHGLSSLDGGQTSKSHHEDEGTKGGLADLISSHEIKDTHLNSVWDWFSGVHDSPASQVGIVVWRLLGISYEVSNGSNLEGIVDTSEESNCTKGNEGNRGDPDALALVLDVIRVLGNLLINSLRSFHDPLSLLHLLHWNEDLLVLNLIMLK